MRLPVPSDDATRYAETKNQLRELDRRTSSVRQNLGGLSSRGKHAWKGVYTGKVSGGGFETLTSFSEEFSNAGLVTRTAAGDFRVATAGDWSLTFVLYSAAASAGIQWHSIEWTAPNPFNGLEIVDARHRTSGYPGAGELMSTLTWTGHVPAECLGSPLRFRVSWGSATGVAVDLTYFVSLEYMGSPITEEDNR